MVLFGAILSFQLIRHQIFGVLPQAPQSEAPIKQRLRGTIVDAHGHPLALQIFRYELVASPNVMNQKTRQAMAEKLAPILGTSPQALVDTFTANKDNSYLL